MKFTIKVFHKNEIVDERSLFEKLYNINVHVYTLFTIYIYIYILSWKGYDVVACLTLHQIIQSEWDKSDFPTKAIYFPSFIQSFSTEKLFGSFTKKEIEYKKRQSFLFNRKPALNGRKEWNEDVKAKFIHRNVNLLFGVVFHTYKSFIEIAEFNKNYT